MHDLGTIEPSLEEFRELARYNRVIPVRVKVLADSLSPIGIYRSLATPDGEARKGTFLLESAAEGGQWSRYSFIGVNSRATLTCHDGEALWQGDTPAGAPRGGDPVEAVRETLALLHTETFEGLPPLTSGLVGYMGWDVVRHWEKLPRRPHDDVNIPDFALNLVSDMAIHDNVDGTVMLVANAINFNGSTDNVDAAYRDAVDRVRAMLEKLASPPADMAVSTLTGTDRVEHRIHEDTVHTWAEQGFLDAIEKAKKNIRDGDVFQIVISRRFEIENRAKALDVYRMLRQSNPSPYMYLYNFETPQGEPYQIVGSSPEALVTLKNGRVSTHPIAGSRPRGESPQRDRELEQQLLADEKERAEHLMLVDLARNDMSRIAVPGTVDVTQFMEVERFSHIMHISSTVTAQLGQGMTAYDVLRATFPAGTLSGAPKPRAMQLLDDYEPTARGVYGGVCGYFDFAGNMDMAIAIRTAVLREGRAYVQAGAGIVMDSVAESELAETVNKSAAPLRAVVLASGLTPLDHGVDNGGGE